MIRKVCIIFAAVVVLLLLILEIRPNRELVVSSDFSRPTPYLSALGPPTRSAPEDGVQRFFAEPVYFDLRLPRWFSRATVEATWVKDIRLADPKLGVALEPSDDKIEGRFALYPMERLGKEGAAITTQTTLDLASLPRTRYGHRVFFSVPGVNATTPFYLSSVVVRAERDSLPAELRRLVRSALNL